MMDGTPPINQVFSAKKIVRLIRREAETQLALNKVMKDVDNAESKEMKYQSCFTKEKIGIGGIIPNPLNFLPEPTYAMENWKKDTEFARQFFNGVNPVMIEVANDPLRQLPKSMINHFGEKKLKELAEKNQLLFVSYDDLADLNVNPHQSFPLPMNNESANGEPAPQDHPKYFYAPIVTFIYDYGTNELDVLGIQLVRTDDARVYTKNTSGENEWLFVKCQVANADSSMHQWVSHLGKTHLAMEVRQDYCLQYM